MGGGCFLQSREESTCLCGVATNNCSHQFLNWWQELPAGLLRFDRSSQLEIKI